MHVNMCSSYILLCWHSAICVCVSFRPAGGKQCGLSWGRSRLKVPGEDVILCDAAHRDRQTHRRLTLCLIDLNIVDIMMCSGLPQLFHSTITIRWIYLQECKVGRMYSRQKPRGAKWQLEAAYFSLWHNSFVLASDPVQSKGLRSFSTRVYWHSSVKTQEPTETPTRVDVAQREI